MMHRLMFESNEDENFALEFLENVKFLLISDVSYVHFGRSSVLSGGNVIEIFDVYNNGHEFGGKLKMLFDRYLLIKNNSVSLTVSVLYPKVVRRTSLNDISLNIGLPVTFTLYMKISRFDIKSLHRMPTT